MDIPIMFLLYSGGSLLGVPIMDIPTLFLGSLFGVPIEVPLCLRVQANGMM